MSRPKKSNGEGTIYFEEDRQTWCVEIQWTDKNGDTHRKRFRDKRKPVVKEKLNEFKKTLIISDGMIKGGSPTIKEYSKIWVDGILRNKLKPSSFMRKQTTLENQVYPQVGDIPIEDLTYTDIQNMINTLNDQGLSYSTIKKAYQAVNGCIKAYCVQTKKVMANPCDGVSLPEVKAKDISDIIYYNKEQRKLIEEEAIRKFKTGTPVYRLGYGIILLMYTGMRIGELIALEWSDIDFKNKTIKISKNTVVVKRKDIDGEERYLLTNQSSTKTRSGHRVIPMTKKAENALYELHKVTGKDKYVLCSKNHKQITPSNMNRMLCSILKMTNLATEENAYRLHALRHTFASMLFQNGCSVKVVSELLGHSDTKITENIYIHLINEQKVRAIQNIDEYSD